jgi:hypothetical protein
MTLLTDRPSPAVERSGRELLLIWQNPGTRRFVKAGLLSIAAEGYRFRYAEEARADPEFFPLGEFPQLDSEYRSSSMPPFFANRVMSSARTSYDDYLRWLALEAESPDLPIEILVRTGASRATDTFHVVEKPTRGARDFVSRFFVSGIGHLPAPTGLEGALRTGDCVLLEQEGDNVVNADAHRVVSLRGVQIGWVPDWLCGEVAELADAGWRFEAIAEKVSPEAPAHVRVLCRLTAHRDS